MASSSQLMVRVAGALTATVGVCCEAAGRQNGLPWIFFDFAVMSGYIVAITRFLPLTQVRRFCAGSALFLLLVALCGVAWNVRDAIAVLAG